MVKTDDEPTPVGGRFYLGLGIGLLLVAPFWAAVWWLIR